MINLFFIREAIDMSSSSAAKKPKLPLIDLVIKSVSEIKRDYSQIIKEAGQMNEPIFIMNHNKPEAVLMTYPFYKEIFAKVAVQIESLLNDLERLENEQLIKTVEDRLNQKEPEWLTFEEAFGNEPDQDNP